MNNIIPCFETCRSSCGSVNNLYCSKLVQDVDRYGGCLMYEPKINKGDKND